MERKTTKMLALIAVIGLCAVALIGAGYAAFTGNAKTYNEGNIATAENLVITNDSFNPMIGYNTAVKEEFNSYAAESGTAYYFDPADATVDTESVTNYALKAVGSSKTIGVTNKTGGSIAGFTISAKSSQAISNSDFVYFFKVTVGTGNSAVSGFIQMPASTDYANVNITMASALADNGSVDVTLQLYIGYDANVWIPNTFIGDIVDTEPQTPTNYIEGRTSTNGPVDLATTGFGFMIAEYVAP